MLFAAGIVLATILLISAHLYSRKRGKPSLRIIKYLTILVISVVILTSCQSSSSQESTKSGEFRIVPTTVALTMTLDKLICQLSAKPTSYKTLPNRYKDVPEIGQPMEPNVEAVKKLKPTHVLSVSTIKDEMQPFYKTIKYERLLL